VLKEFLLEDHPIAMRQEVDEDLKHSAPELHGRSIATQFLALDVQHIVGKEVVHRPALLWTLAPLGPQALPWPAAPRRPPRTSLPPQGDLS
jgi:hypothetical protein